MSNDEAYLEDIKSDEIKKLTNLLYNQPKSKDNLSDFQKVWNEYSDIDLKNNFEDIDNDEILRVLLSSDTINKIENYMKNNDLYNFSRTVNNLIENGLKSTV